ncbi:hypothetical protein [Pectinatus frisingensis]|uniref:hypothetical protein n=1 Tax=Pectinatus frisingensis TaxID=865 RepID=UPI0018C7ABC6|nr:hypothetical protein [Pectinatus frisingensis]
MVNKIKTTMDDIVYISNHLRQEDIDECMTINGKLPIDVLKESFLTAKECIVGKENGVILCIVGVTKDNQIWMLFTREFDYMRPSIIKQAIPIVKKLVKKYGYLHGYTGIENIFIQKFVRILGFSLTEKSDINGFKVIRYKR